MGVCEILDFFNQSQNWDLLSAKWYCRNDIAEILQKYISQWIYPTVYSMSGYVSEIPKQKVNKNKIIIV